MAGEAVAGTPLGKVLAMETYTREGTKRHQIYQKSQRGLLLPVSPFQSRSKIAIYEIIAESADGRMRLYIEFIRSTPRILVMEKAKSGFFEEKRDHPYSRATPTNEVKKVLTELGY